jgi:tetratricopeptide (TPR) repeat protein
MDQRMSAFEHYERGVVLKKVHMFYQAIDDFRKAALDPQCAGKAYVQMALCLRAAGRHDEAVMAFRQAVASPTVSSEEQRHILYHMGQTLESLGRHAESLEVYGWIRKEDPGFRDVTQRIKHLTSGRRGPAPRSQARWQAWMEEVRARGRQLKPHMESVLEQTGEWLRRHAETLKGHRFFERTGSQSQARGVSERRSASRVEASQSARVTGTDERRTAAPAGAGAVAEPLFSERPDRVRRGRIA